MGGDYDYVPKSGAGLSNTGRRLFWANVGVSVNGHTGFLSLSREFVVRSSKRSSSTDAKSDQHLPPQQQKQAVHHGANDASMGQHTRSKEGTQLSPAMAASFGPATAAAAELEMRFVPELVALRIPGTSVLATVNPAGAAAAEATGAAPDHATAAGAVHHIGDTALLSGFASRQVEVRAHFPPMPPGATDA